MKPTKRTLVILLAVIAGIIALVLQQRRTTEQQVTAGNVPQPGYRQTPLWGIYDWVAQALDHAVGWDKVPTPVGLLILIGLRNILRQQNLHDTTHEPAI